MARADVIKVMGVYAAHYVHAKVGQDTIDVYADRYQDTDPILFRTAAEVCMNRCTFLPTFKELNDAITELMTPEGITPLEAWGKFKQLVARHGYYRKPTPEQIGDPVLAQVIEAIGWHDYCQSDSDEEMSWRARFIESYKTLQTRSTENLRLPAATTERMKQIRQAQTELTRKLTAPSGSR